MKEQQVSIPRCDEARNFIRQMVTGKTRGNLAYIVPLTGGDDRRPGYGQVDFQDNPGKFLEQRMRELEYKRWGHDHAVPVIQPSSYGGGILATAFGARYDPVMNWTHPVVTEAEDIESLPLKVSLDDGLIPKALETIDYVVRETGGQIPIQMYNAGGPMDIATHVVKDQALLLALSLYPEAVHALMDVCTDLYIEFNEAQRRIVPEFAPTILKGMYWPDGEGILCGEDWLSVISPQMAVEFEVPYINRISDVFGGVMIHACGTLEINYDVLKDHVRNLRGLYFHVGESSFPKAVECFRGTDVVLIVDWALNQHYAFSSRIDCVRHILETKSEDTSVFLMANPAKDRLVVESDTNAVSAEVLEFIENYSSD